MTTSDTVKAIADHIAQEAELHGWDEQFDTVLISQGRFCYVGECVVCHEDTMLPPGEKTGICDACSPHVCIPELPEDDWCDLCGRTFPTPI